MRNYREKKKLWEKEIMERKNYRRNRGIRGEKTEKLWGKPR